MDTIENLLLRLDQLNDIGASLSHQRNLDCLLEKILLAAKAITRADGGTLYLLSEDKKHLHFEIVRTASLNLAFGGSSAKTDCSKFHDLPLFRADGSPNNQMVAVYAANTGKTINIADAYTTDEGFDFSGTRLFEDATGYRSHSFLTVPMSNQEGTLIGVMQLINAINPLDGKITAFSAADQRLAESLASQAAVALSNRYLVQQLEDLFEALIQLINLAIDEKSRHTGGHCQRVPALTMLLAEAADTTSEGPLASFKLSDQDRYELRIAALLHDCGKITTPVHVVDKSTKLQTLFDRIHLLDTRFEVLKRDAEIAALKAIVAGEPAALAEERLAQELTAIQSDREALRRANIGGEGMSDELRARVDSIASRYRWKNVDGVEAPFLTEDEWENLSIRAGTLTQAERQIINYHIVATIKMLEQLPWPKHLKNVPEYAGAHHERVDGKGYPRGLKREQMSWQARMMGIADIFEALTAKDRPYKEAMKLSQALNIMENFKKNGHIDPDLYDIFVSGEVFRHYAARFLSPAQVDC